MPLVEFWLPPPAAPFGVRNHCPWPRAGLGLQSRRACLKLWLSHWARVLSCLCCGWGPVSQTPWDPDLSGLALPRRPSVCCLKINLSVQNNETNLTKALRKCAFSLHSCLLCAVAGVTCASPSGRMLGSRLVPGGCPTSCTPALVSWLGLEPTGSRPPLAPRPWAVLLEAGWDADGRDQVTAREDGSHNQLCAKKSARARAWAQWLVSPRDQRVSGAISGQGHIPRLQV